MAHLTGLGEIPTVITAENYNNAVNNNNQLFHALKGEIKQAHNYFMTETDGFTKLDNLYKTTVIQEAWKKHLTQVNNIASKLSLTTRKGYTPYYSEGVNYNSAKDLSITEIAKLIKKELEIRYEDWKFSVTTDSFSGGRSVTVKVLNTPHNPYSDKFIEYMKNDEVVWHEYNRDARFGERESYYNEAFQKDLKKIESISNQYNFNDSDSSTDYFHVSYYDHVGVNESQLLHKYFPSNKSVVKNIERNQDWDKKTKEANKRAAERKGKFLKNQPIMYQYTSKGGHIPEGKYEGRILKSPNGRSSSGTGYEIEFYVDKKRGKDGTIISLEKRQRYTTKTGEAKLSAMEEENPLLKQQFKKGEKVYFTLDKEIFDSYKSKTVPILLPGVYEVEITGKTKGEYPLYSFQIPFTFLHEATNKEYTHLHYFTRTPIDLKPLTSAIITKPENKKTFAFAKAKALALEIELELLDLAGLGGYHQKEILRVVDSYKYLTKVQLMKVAAENYQKLISKSAVNKHKGITIKFNSMGKSETIFKGKIKSHIVLAIVNLISLLENAKYNNYKSTELPKHTKKRIKGFLNFTAKMVVDNEIKTFRIPVAYKTVGDKVHYHITELEMKKVLVTGQ